MLIQSLQKTIEKLLHQQPGEKQAYSLLLQNKTIGHEEEEERLAEEEAKQEIDSGNTSSFLEQYSEAIFKKQIAALETQFVVQRDLLDTKDAQLRDQAVKLHEQESELKKKDEVMGALQKNAENLECMLVRMEKVVQKSNHLQEEYAMQMAKLKQCVEEQDGLLEEREALLMGEAEKVKYLSVLCCEAKEAMAEDKNAICKFEYTIHDQEEALREQREDLEECKSSLFSANQIITLTEKRDAFLKPYVRRLADHYRTKNKQQGCGGFKRFFKRRQQSNSQQIVDKLEKVFLPGALEEVRC